jgi:hypothetical protein
MKTKKACQRLNLQANVQLNAAQVKVGDDLLSQIDGLVGRLLVNQLHGRAKVTPSPTQPMSDLKRN